MDMSVDCKLQVALPAALLNTQLSVPTAAPALPLSSAPHITVAAGTVQPPLAPDVQQGGTVAAKPQLQTRTVLEGTNGTLQH